MRRFLDAQPYRIVGEFEREEGWHVIRARIRDEPPPELSVLVGSIAYQLLSTLNHVAWELAVRKVGEQRAQKVRRRIEFPIAENPTDFRSRDVLNHVSKQAVACFERLQPYQRGKPPWPLVTLKAVADADKHRILAPSLARRRPERP